MTTAEFIKKTYGTKNDKYGRYGYDRRCSSVLTDKNGNVYSYGYHYPLLFKVAGIDFINTTRYSNTTAKHIVWARKATDYTAVSVELNGKKNPEGFTIEDMRKILLDMHTKITDEMLSKKRKDTQAYLLLEAQATRISKDFNRLAEVN